MNVVRRMKISSKERKKKMWNLILIMNWSEENVWMKRVYLSSKWKECQRIFFVLLILVIIQIYSDCRSISLSIWKINDVLVNHSLWWCTLHSCWCTMSNFDDGFYRCVILALNNCKAVHKFNRISKINARNGNSIFYWFKTTFDK